MSERADQTVSAESGVAERQRRDAKVSERTDRRSEHGSIPARDPVFFFQHFAAHNMSEAVEGSGPEFRIPSSEENIFSFAADRSSPTSAELEAPLKRAV